MFRQYIEQNSLCGAATPSTLSHCTQTPRAYAALNWVMHVFEQNSFLPNTYLGCLLLAAGSASHQPHTTGDCRTGATGATAAATAGGAGGFLGGRPTLPLPLDVLLLVGADEVAAGGRWC